MLVQKSKEKFEDWEHFLVKIPSKKLLKGFYFLIGNSNVSYKQIRLNQNLSEDHLSAQVASNT